MSLLALRKATFRQYLATFIACIAMLEYGLINGWPSAALPKLMSKNSPMVITKPEMSWMVSLMFLGNILSPLPSGYIMDRSVVVNQSNSFQLFTESRFGRKSALLWLNTLSTLSWFILYQAATPQILYIGRFLGGMYIGVVQTVIPIYIGELAEPQIRGSLGTLTIFMLGVGALADNVVGPYISYKMLISLAGSFSILFFVAFSMIPESPYYYFMKGDENRARKSLEWFRASNKIDEELEKIKMAVKTQMSHSGRLRDVFARKGNSRAVITVSVLGALRACAGVVATSIFLSTTLPKLGSLSPEECTVIAISCSLAAAFFSSFIIDRFKRRTLLILSASICCMTTFLIATWFYLDSINFNIQSFNWAPFICICIFGVSYSIGLGPVFVAIRSELFPANLKGHDSAIVTMVISVSSFGTTNTYLPITQAYGVHMNYCIYSVVNIIIILHTLTSVIETKGKSLQEIQDKLNRVERSTVVMNSFAEEKLLEPTELTNLKDEVANKIIEDNVISTRI